MNVYVEAFAPQTLLQRMEWALQVVLTKWATGIVLVVTTLQLLADFGLVP